MGRRVQFTTVQYTQTSKMLQCSCSYKIEILHYYIQAAEHIWVFKLKPKV